MARIKVIVDGVVFENAYQTGIWRVFYETMRRTVEDVEYTLLLLRKPEKPIPAGVEVMYSAHRLPWRYSDIRGRLRRKYSIRLLSAKKYQDAVWHSTFFTLDPSRERSSVVSVYDMIAERYFHLGGEWATAQQRMKYDALSRASEVLTISNSSADDLQKFYPELKKRVTVMPLGAEHLVTHPVGGQHDLQYALFVGNRAGYKNFALVLEALASPKWPPSVKLRVVGSEFSQMERSLISYFGVGVQVEHVGRVDDLQLASYYRNSVGLIFPSFSEGFGIPVLEAQANGCVPLLSDIEVFHEVAGRGAIFFNPRDPGSLCQAMRQSLDKHYRCQIQREAQENLPRYSWDKSADSVLNAYRRALTGLA